MFETIDHTLSAQTENLTLAAEHKDLNDDTQKPQSPETISKPTTETMEDKAEQVLITAHNADRRAVLKHLYGAYSSARLQKVIKILQELYSNKAQEEAEQERARSVKQASMIQAVTALKGLGINLEEFKNFVVQEDIEAKLKSSKYIFVDVNGITRFWSGQGKIPTALAELMARDGTVKEDYLRDKTKSQINKTTTSKSSIMPQTQEKDLV